MSLLGTYEGVSSQKINAEKTSLFFSSNTPSKVQSQIQTVLGAPDIKQAEKYLGLPLIIGRNKSKAFSAIKEHVGSNLHGWKEKLLSQVGKEVLLKAVAQSIPTFAMSCFLLPKRWCLELNKMMSNFWWGQFRSERKMH